MKQASDDVKKFPAEINGIMTWHLGVHIDMKSNVVATMMLGSGVNQIVSTKQKVNTRSSTEAELMFREQFVQKK